MSHRAQKKDGNPKVAAQGHLFYAANVTHRGSGNQTTMSRAPAKKKRPAFAGQRILAVFARGTYAVLAEIASAEAHARAVLWISRTYVA